MVARILLGMMTYCMALSAYAYDFSAADALFVNRADGVQAIESARSAYKAALPQLSGDDLVYAVEQLARLDNLEGGLLGEEGNEDERIEIFDRCLTTLDKIAPTVAGVGERPEFYYWKATCLSLWAQANGILTSLFRSGELFEYLDKGEEVDETYEGGGFWRVKGAVYAKLPGFNPFGPTRDLDESKRLLEKAINAPAYTNSRRPETDTGNYFYSNYYYYAQTLEALDESDQAVGTLEDAIANYDAGYISEDRIPESLLSYNDLKRLLSEY